jgi:hypothetical protein
MFSTRALIFIFVVLVVFMLLTGASDDMGIRGRG